MSFALVMLLEWVFLNLIPSITNYQHGFLHSQVMALGPCCCKFFWLYTDDHFVYLFQTMRFGISLAVRSLEGVPISKFAFRPVPALNRHGVDVARDDILQNLVSREDQLTNGSTPWRGPREKSVLLMQMLIESSSSLGDVVLDCTAATG